MSSRSVQDVIFIKTLCSISNNTVHRTCPLVCTIRIIEFLLCLQFFMINSNNLNNQLQIRIIILVASVGTAPT